MVLNGVTQSLYKAIVFLIYSQCETISNIPPYVWDWKCGNNKWPLRDNNRDGHDILKESHNTKLGNFWVYMSRNLWILKHVKDPNTKNWHTLAEKSQMEVKGGDSGSFWLLGYHIKNKKKKSDEEYKYSH